MRRMIVGLLCCVLAGLSGCKKEGTASPDASGKPRYTVAVIAKGTTHEFWKTVEAGAREAAKDLNVEIKWDGPTKESEHDKQKAIFDNMVNLGVNGIALAPTDEEVLRRPVEAASERGLPIVIFDSNINTDKYVSFVATDNEKGGRMAGEKLVELLGEAGGNVVLLRYTEGSGSTLRRESGFMKALEGHANITLVDKQFTDGTPTDAIDKASSMLTTRVKDNKLELAGAFASNEPTSLGMLKALERLKKQGVQVNVKFVGFDASEGLIVAMKAGTIDALVVQDPRRMGYLAVETLVNRLDGKQVPKYVPTDVQVVTAARLKDKAIRALLGLKDD